MTPSGAAPTLGVPVTSTTNQIWPTNVLYDSTGNGNSNGNVTQFGTSLSLTTLAYDVANRLATVNSTNAYAYSSANQRVYYRNSSGMETLYVYGTGGKKLATYTIAGTSNGQVNFTLQSQNVYFAGRLISAEGNAVAVDPSGSVRWNAATGGHTYYPYGAEYSATASDTEKYATYTRDNLTGLDYAMNRYYASFWGRFMSPDPYAGSVSQGDPQSWNRYAYTGDDPINRGDPTGLYSAGDCIANPDACNADDWGQPGDLWGAGPNGLPCGFGYGTACGIMTNNNACVEAPVGLGYAPTPPDPTPIPCPPPAPVPPPLQLSLTEVDDCIYPKGTGILPGVWTLEVEYEVLVNGQAVHGNGGLTDDGASTVSEKVTTTSGGPISGGGVWCLATAACTSYGSLSTNGTFWDILAGNGTANQSFLIGGQVIPVSFPGTASSQTVLKNVYKSASQTISVSSGSLVGNSSTARCESVHLGPVWH